MRVNSTDLQNAFGKYLSLVEKEDIIVIKNGKTVARLSHYLEPENFFIHEGVEEYKTRRISYQEYLSLADSSDQRYELISGEVYLMVSPSFNHQLVVNEISGQFYNYFRDKSCCSLTAPLDVRLCGFALKFEEDPNVVQPDVLVICDEDKVSEDNKYEGVPTLIVEVLSPSTRGKDMITKLNLYMKSGISEYWVVDLEEKKINQYSFTGERDLDKMISLKEDDIIESIYFEDLKIALADIFKEIRS